ncbi:MAG: cobalt-precorrin-5B (C(1))-methyltransferase CbiD [Eggerthellaceae bacterium]
MAFEHYIYSGTERLRCGYTTGSCAALVTQAAARALLSGDAEQKSARIVTPAGIPVEVDVEFCTIEDGCATAGVRKDAGDDCDATDGILVCATVCLSQEPGVHIDGGTGVGRVTKPGLQQPVGEAAINNGPRAMIGAEAQAAAERFGYAGGIKVLVSIPEGEAVAAKTFNPHLGITGGISVLGTSGIVEPKSITALLDSIELEVRQLAALGNKTILIVPGNYGHDFAQTLPQLESMPQVSCANFIGQTLDFCLRYGFEKILVVGHIGKLVKVAGGIMDTHSRVADCRCEIMCAHAAVAGANTQTCHAIMAAATTDAAIDILKSDSADLFDTVVGSIGAAIHERLRRRCTDAAECQFITFSNVHGELYRSDGVQRLIERWQEEENMREGVSDE